MASAPLIKNGISYVTAKAAAPSAGISADYITKLCRRGEIDALPVDNTWYVNEASLAAFVARKEAAKKVQAALNAQQLKEVASRAQAAKPEQPPTLVHRSARTNPAYAFGVATIVLLIAMSAGIFALSTPTQQSQLLATAAATLPTPIQKTIDRTASTVFDFLCPFISDCGAAAGFASAPTATTTRTLASQRPATFATTSRTLDEVRPPQQPTVIERVVERTETIIQGAPSGITGALLDARFAALETYLVGRIDVLAYQGDRQAESLADSLADGIGGGGFDDIDITDSTFTGGRISGASLSGITFSGETDFTSLTVSAATSTSATSTNLYVSGSFGFGTDTGLLQSDAGDVSTLANGSDGQVLKIVGGTLAWGTDLTGGGGGSGAWATTSDRLAVYPSDPTQVVLVGSSATTTSGNILEVSGNSLFRGAATSYGLFTSPRFTATSSIASIFPYASTTALSAATLCLSSDCRNAWPTDTSFSTTSADYWKSISNFFSTSSALYFSATGLAFSTTSADAWKDARNFFASSSADYFIHSSSTIPKVYTANAFSALQSFQNASTTNFSATYASSTQGFFGSLSVGNLTGFLKATAGAIATAAVDLASDVTGILGVARGGTGWAAVEAGSILYGNGSAALATTTVGTSGQVLALVGNVPTWVATSTLATISGTLDVAKGGTGSTSFGYGLVLSPGGASALTNIATSSLGLLTTHVGEGSALYYTDGRVQTYLGTLDKGFFFSTTSADAWKLTRNFFATSSADYWKSVTDLFSTTSATYFAHSSTTLPKLYSSNTWTGSNSFGSLSLGSLNGPLHTNAGVVGATTSIGVLYGGTGLTTAPTYGQLLVGNSSGGFTLTATSSLGIGSSGSGGATLTAVRTGTSTADWSKPSNIAYIVVELWGGGGAGGEAGTAGGIDSPGGGGAGGYMMKTFSASALAATTSVRITIGAGGTPNNNAAGNSGGTSNFGGMASSTGGGGGGRVSGGVGAGGVGGIGQGGDVNLRGADGSVMTATDDGNNTGGNGGSAPRGGGGGAGANVDTGSNGTTGADYGGGGGATGDQTSGTAGSGGPGGYVIYEYTMTGLSVGSVGSGTQGQLPFYSSAGQDLTATSSLFIATSGNLGVGTTSPWKKVSINGDIALTGSLFDSTASSGTSGMVLQSTASGVRWVATSTLGISTSLFTDGGATTYLTSSDSFAIGTTTANSKLTVYGDAFLEGSSRYLNFGTSTGSNGYGFRDNGGLIEFKNAGGTWQGVTTATTGPSFRVGKSGTQSFTENGSLQIITFQTESFDTNNNFESNRFTPTVPGKYVVSVTISGTAGADGNYFGVTIHKNGTSGDVVGSSYDIRGNANTPTVSATGIIDMNGTTDYIEVYVGGSDSSPITATASFSGAMIAPVNGNNAAGWANDGSASFLLDNADKVGVGTTTPWAKLSINSSAGIPQFVIGSSTTQFIVDANGNVGIGTTSPGQKLDVVGTVRSTGFTLLDNFSSIDKILALSNSNDGMDINSTYVAGSAAGSGVLRFLTVNAERMRIAANGNVGIGTTSPWRTLSVVGTMSINGLTLNTGAASASLCLSSSNEVTRNTDNESCITSSARYKHDIQSLIGTTTLETLLALRPVTFEYNETPGVRYGLIAEEVNSIDPTLVGYDDQGMPNSVRYTSIVPLLIRAFQDVANITDRFKENLVAFLADTQNGIVDLFAKHLHAENITANSGTFGTVSATTTRTAELCVGQVCVSESQFMSVFGQTAGDAAPEFVPPPPSNDNDPPAPHDGDEDADIESSSATSSPSTSDPDPTTPAQLPHANSSSPEPANENSESPPAITVEPSVPAPEHDNQLSPTEATGS